MKKTLISASSLASGMACLLLMLAGCQKNIERPNDSSLTDQTQSLEERRFKGRDFEQVNLVANNDEYNATRIDDRLINPWGIAFAPSGPNWLAVQGTGLSFVLNATGGDILPPVTIPSPGSETTGGHPTGIVFNSSRGFKLPNGNPARFIFDAVDGIISGWNGGPAAVKALDNSATSAYTGLAIAADGVDSFLYAANFRTGKIDVYDANWQRVWNKPFRDFFIPRGYAPFNIQNIDNNLFVTYAKVAPDGRSESGFGKGFVNVYKSNGRFIRRFASRGVLNAPWGVVMAPESFWSNKKWDGDDDDDEDNSGKGSGNRHHHDFHSIKQLILVGNFGNGRINAFNQDGEFVGRLRSKGKAIVIEGLWAITFAPTTATAIDPNWLFFAAGPDDEQDGVVGYIK